VKALQAVAESRAHCKKALSNSDIDNDGAELNVVEAGKFSTTYTFGSAPPLSKSGN
jgi:hypothetical protein